MFKDRTPDVTFIVTADVLFPDLAPKVTADVSEDLTPEVITGVVFQDLASLLKALCDAQGSSIRLPPNVTTDRFQGLALSEVLNPLTSSLASCFRT